MKFHDFLPYCERLFREFKDFTEASPLGMPTTDLPFSASHIVNLGDDRELTEAISGMKAELTEDMRQGIPLPFDDTTFISYVYHRHMQFCDVDCKKDEEPPLLLADRVIKLGAVESDMDVLSKEIQAEATLHESFLHLRVIEDTPLVNVWTSSYMGLHPKGNMILVVGASLAEILASQKKGMEQYVEMEKHSVQIQTAEILYQSTIVAHPMNYVVKVTPKLTTREANRVRKGKGVPMAKAPHFIVVDHDVVIRLRDGEEETGTHASPIPHHRRGHWRRLSEKHKKAKMLKGDRVWVRPAFIGERNFENTKNYYEVLLDFKNENIAGPAN